MALKCGIVGLPNVGKSTLFNCLSNARAQAANFPFCTIEPNIGVITVPDARLNKLAELVKPERLVPNTIEIVDIAGLVKGASKGEGLGNKFLGNIRETDAILHVLRCFSDDNVVHVHGNVDPIRDKEIIDIELQLKDLESVEKKLQKVERAAKTGDKEGKLAFDVLSRYKEHLEQGLSARTAPVELEEREQAADLFLLTEKPVMYVCNVDEAALKTENAYVEQVRKMAEAEGAGVLVICAAIESDIAELESFEDRQLFLEDLGLVAFVLMWRVHYKKRQGMKPEWCRLGTFNAAVHQMHLTACCLHALALLRSLHYTMAQPIAWWRYVTMTWCVCH
jgi:GTP-binding protein YchF